MQIRIQRDSTEPGKPILGIVSVVDEELGTREPLCHSQEPAQRADGVFVPCESPLPPGNYNLSMTHCRRFGNAIVPLIVSTPNTMDRRRATDRLGMRVHPGHPEPSTGGELILGMRRDASGKIVTGTEPAFRLFVKRVSKAIAAGEAVDVVIA